MVLADWFGSSMVRVTMPSSPLSHLMVVLSLILRSPFGRRGDYRRSTTVAMPMPPPTHKVQRP